MSTLALRLAGSQSYATSSFTVKPTEGVPTRSAILGLLAGALGQPRNNLPDWFTELDVWVRVDAPGTVTLDFHTINPPTEKVAEARTRLKKWTQNNAKATASYTVPRGDGGKWESKGKVNPMITQRAYLAGAEFIVTISHPDDERVAELGAAVRNPKFMLFLGRKGFAPAFPFALGVHDGEPEALLAALPTGAGGDLPVYQIVGDRNYPHAHVTPEHLTSTIDLWNGWKTA